MDKNQKILLITLSVYILGEFSAIAITNLYLWELANSFQEILYFNLFVFTGMAIGGLISSIIGVMIGNKFIFTISMAFYAIQFLILLIAGKNIFNHLILLGLISGFAIGGLSYSYNVISQIVTERGGREKFLGIKTSLLNTIIFLGAPLLTFVASYFRSYVPVFCLALFLILIAGFFATKLSFIEEKRSFQFVSARRAISKFPDLKSFLLAKYLFGVQSGLFWVVLGIITLQFVGDLFKWGIFSQYLLLSQLSQLTSMGKKQICNSTNILQS